MIYKNIKYLSEETGKNLKRIAKDLEVSPPTLWSWGQGKKPNPNTLRRIARYFSETFSTPYEIFDEGRTLLEKDFEQILKDNGIQAQNLHIKNSIPKKFDLKIENQPLDAEISEHERNFIINLRRLVRRNPHIETPESALNDIFDLINEVGPGSNSHYAIIRMIRGLRQSNEDVVQSPKSAGGDKKSDKD